MASGSGSNSGSGNGEEEWKPCLPTHVFRLIEERNDASREASDCQCPYLLFFSSTFFLFAFSISAFSFQSRSFLLSAVNGKVNSW